MIMISEFRLIRSFRELVHGFRPGLLVNASSIDSEELELEFTRRCDLIPECGRQFFQYGLEESDAS